MFANVHIVNATDWTNCEDKLLENFQVTQNTKISNQTLKWEMNARNSITQNPSTYWIHPQYTNKGDLSGRNGGKKYDVIQKRK